MGTVPRMVKATSLGDVAPSACLQLFQLGRGWFCEFCHFGLPGMNAQICEEMNIDVLCFQFRRCLSLTRGSQFPFRHRS